MVNSFNERWRVVLLVDLRKAGADSVYRVVAVDRFATLFRHRGMEQVTLSLGLDPV